MTRYVIKNKDDLYYCGYKWSKDINMAKIDNDYIVLNNEYWEDSNCYYRLIEFLDKYFKLDDLGYDCLIKTGKDTVDYVDIETVCDNLGIESDFMYDEEDE